MALALDRELLKIVDSARGHTGRSEYIRVAMVERLTRQGVPCDPELAYSRDRVRKEVEAALNESPPSAQPATPPANPVSYKRKRPKK